MRVIMITRGTEGDVRPLVRIGRALQQRGHEIVLIAHAALTPLADGTGFECVTLDSHTNYEQMLLVMEKTEDYLGSLRLFETNVLHLIPRVYELIANRYVPQETVLLMHGNAFWLARHTAEKLNIPIVTIFTAPGIMTLNTLGGPSILLTNTGAAYRQAATEALNRARASFQLPPIIDLQKWWGQDNLCVLLWPEWFAAPTKDIPAEMIQAGFLSGSDAISTELPAEVEMLLAKGVRPVLVTGGTGVFVNEDYYSTCLEACRQTGRRVILVARRQVALPASLPGDVSVFGALPFARLMPQVGAIIHHGGIGTLAQAFEACTPQIILAQGIDRPDNAMRVQRLGVGRFLPPSRWKVEAVVQALKEMLDQPSVQERCRDLAERIRQQDTLGIIIQAVERAGRQEPASAPDGKNHD